MESMMLEKDLAYAPRPERHKCKVLIVDGDPVKRSEITDYLREKSFRVREAGDCRDALKAIHRLRPCVVVMDINIRGCDGIQASQVSTALHPEIPIILMSGNPEDVRRALQSDCGASAVFEKPLKLSDVAKHLSAFVFRDEGRIVDDCV